MIGRLSDERLREIRADAMVEGWTTWPDTDLLTVGGVTIWRRQ